MAIVKTSIGEQHLELIKIFFKANDLPMVEIHTHIKNIRGEDHFLIQLGWADEDEETASKITYMAIVHLGIQNMLDDYLMKCGVDVYSIPPPSIVKQEKREHAEKVDKEFNEHFNQRKQSI